MSCRRDALIDWHRFLRAESHVLRSYPGLLFQQGANQPDASAPARMAERRFEAGLEKRPWFRRINKPLTRSACLMTLTGHSHQVYGCAFSPDGRRVVSASADHSLKVWDVATGAELLTLSGHSEPVSDFGVSPDGRRIVSASYDKTLKLWDVESGRELATLLGHGEQVWTCAFSSDGRLVVSLAADDTLRLWDAATGSPLCLYPVDLPLVLASTGRGTFVIGTESGAVEVLRLELA